MHGAKKRKEGEKIDNRVNLFLPRIESSSKTRRRGNRTFVLHAERKVFQTKTHQSPMHSEVFPLGDVRTRPDY